MWMNRTAPRCTTLKHSAKHCHTPAQGHCKIAEETHSHQRFVASVCVRVCMCVCVCMCFCSCRAIVRVFCMCVLAHVPVMISQSLHLTNDSKYISEMLFQSLMIRNHPWHQIRIRKRGHVFIENRLPALMGGKGVGGGLPHERSSKTSCATTKHSTCYVCRYWSIAFSNVSWCVSWKVYVGWKRLCSCMRAAGVLWMTAPTAQIAPVLILLPPRPQHLWFRIMCDVYVTHSSYEPPWVHKQGKNMWRTSYILSPCSSAVIIHTHTQTKKYNYTHTLHQQGKNMWRTSYILSLLVHWRWLTGPRGTTLDAPHLMANLLPRLVASPCTHSTVRET